MNFKKKVNGSWHDAPHYVHNTSTDTITTLPAVLYPNDTTATVGLKGNMQQTGTPTPTTPIQPSECGERTKNLFDKTNETIGKYMLSDGTIASAQSYSLTDYIPIIEENSYTISAVANQSSAAYHCFYTEDKVFISSINCEMTPRTFTTPANAKYIRCSYRIVSNPNIMLNFGSTALPYEPYGYKLDIKSANTTTPVYLGEVETTRKVKKLVLTGGENNWTYEDAYERFGIGLSNMYVYETRLATIVCTHYPCIDDGRPIGEVPNNTIYAGKSIPPKLFIKTDSYTTINDFKSYLAAQYAAGTPVTVWYVLAEPETGIVNEPLRKIGEYADEVSNVATIPTITGKDTFDVDVTLKPSEVELTYTGWHDAQCKEYDGSQWV